MSKYNINFALCYGCFSTATFQFLTFPAPVISVDPRSMTKLFKADLGINHANMHYKSLHTHMFKYFHL